MQLSDQLAQVSEVTVITETLDEQFFFFLICLQQGYITDDVMVSVSPPHYPEFTLFHFVEEQLKFNQS